MTQVPAVTMNNDEKRRRRQWRGPVWKAARIVIVLGFAAAVVYWLRFAPVLVAGYAVKPGTVIAEVMGTGTLEARVSATISPKISGLIMKVLVDQGDRITEGQVLFRLDDSDLRSQAEMAESALAAAQAAIARQEAEVASAHAVLDKAHYDFDRVGGLLEHDIAAIVEFQDATKVLRVAEADLRRAEAALAEERSQVTVADRTLGYQQTRLADTVITSPFDGLVARRDRDPGDVVVPGASVLLALNTGEMWVSAWVDETEMARLHPEQPARVVFRSKPERSYPGHVVRLGREADRETREFVVDVLAKTLPENWAVGQRAEVYIEAARADDVLAAPLRAIVWRDGRSGVFIENDAHAVWRPVRLGIRGAENIEIKEGLAVGTRIIAPASPTGAGLRDGQRVDVR